jgi:hypothetical protein
VYDEVDERSEAVFAALLAILRAAPDRLGKKMLCALLEDRALAEALLERAGGAWPEGNEGREAALGELWDRVETLRDQRADGFLRAFNREEF